MNRSRTWSACTMLRCGTSISCGHTPTHTYKHERTRGIDMAINWPDKWRIQLRTADENGRYKRRIYHVQLARITGATYEVESGGAPSSSMLPCKTSAHNLFFSFYQRIDPWPASECHCLSLMATCKGSPHFTHHLCCCDLCLLQHRQTSHTLQVRTCVPQTHIRKN